MSHPVTLADYQSNLRKMQLHSNNLTGNAIVIGASLHADKQRLTKEETIFTLIHSGNTYERVQH